MAEYKTLMKLNNGATIYPRTVASAVAAGDGVPVEDKLNEAAQDIETLQQDMGDVSATLLSHENEYVPHLGTTTNIGNAYSVTTGKVIAVNSKFSVKFNVAATGTSTLNISSDGVARTLTKPGGGDFKPKAGIYTFIRDGVNFQLLGEGGDLIAGALSNMLLNGNFANGTTNWSLVGTGSIVDGKLHMTANASNGRVEYTRTFTFYPNRKYYISVTGSPVTDGWSWGLDNEDGDEIYRIAKQTTAMTYSMIFDTNSSQYDGLSITLHLDSASYPSTVDFSNVMVIDLTGLYEANEEPDKGDFDDLVSAKGGFLPNLVELGTADATGTSLDLLAGKSMYANGVKVNGGIPIKAGGSDTRTTTPFSWLFPDESAYSIVGNIPADAFYKAEAKVNMYDDDYLPRNIVAGKSPFGLAGTFAPKLHNLIHDGSFEGTGDFIFWQSSSLAAFARDTNVAKFGSASAITLGATGNAEGFIWSSPMPFIQGHKYYASVWVESNIANKTADLYVLGGSYPHGSVTLAQSNTWYRLSFIIDDSALTTGNYQIRLDNNNAYEEVYMWFDGVMLFDLTDDFGAGNEPDEAIMGAIVQTHGWWDSNNKIYDVGDSIPRSKLTQSASDLWSITHSEYSYAVAVDSSGYVYAPWGYVVHKINSNSNQVWEFTGHVNIINAIVVDSSSNVYSGSADKTVRKIDSSGSQVWSYTDGVNAVLSVAVISGNVYYGTQWNDAGPYLRKLNSSGSKVWDYIDVATAVVGVAADNSSGYIYYGDGFGVGKINSSGSRIWLFETNASITKCVAVDNVGNVYSGHSDGVVRKINSNGTTVWSITRHTDRVNAVTTDSAGNIYSASDDNTVCKFNSSGTEIWSYVNANIYNGIAVDSSGYVYAASRQILQKIDGQASKIIS